jgi:hypothetical protein
MNAVESEQTITEHIKKYAVISSFYIVTVKLIPRKEEMKLRIL